MIRKSLLLVILLVISSAVTAEELTFDYAEKSDTVRVEYDPELKVVLEGVNTLDYEYSQRVEYELPKPMIGPVVGPLGPGSASNRIRSVTDQSPIDTCMKNLNDKIAGRMVVYGQEALKRWHDDAATGVNDTTCADDELKELIQDHLRELGEKENVGRMDATSDELSKANRLTGPGGAITITITATAQKTTYSKNLASPERTPLDVDSLGAQEKDKVRKHQEERKYRIEFGPPKGVTFSFGPYLGGIARKEFDQVRNPDHDPNDPSSSEFIVGLSEDSDISYGVAAYWNAPLVDTEWFGMCWGVAYTLSNELDTAVNGLLGVYFRPVTKGPGLVNVGLAMGREREISGGRAVGRPIGDTEEIPVTVETTISWFVGYSFRFGGQ